ncbi:hypothetical protein B0H21DRAFT_826069 [Amylocystis lapponica]|nr:hypothetical protein B0H21DRAFT_826069 [Amylocystis lapponica]
MSLNRQELLLAYFEALFLSPSAAASDVISSWENLELLVPEMERQDLPLLHTSTTPMCGWSPTCGKTIPTVTDDDDDDDAAVGMEHREDVDFLIMNGAIVGTQRLFRIILNAVQVIWS